MEERNHPIPTRLRVVYNAYAKSLLRYVRGDECLNLACGHDIDREGGTYTKDYLGGFKKVVNVDKSKTTSYAEYEIPYSGGLIAENPVDIFACAENLPFDDGRFDFIFCSWGFYHFDRHRAIREMRRVVKDHGGFYISFCRKPYSFMMETRSIIESNDFQIGSEMWLWLNENLDGRDGLAMALFGKVVK